MANIKIFGTLEQQKEGKCEVVRTILEQLGGVQFIIMTGCSNLTVIDGKENLGGLKMNLKTNKSKANRVIIELTSDDLYNISFTSEWFDNKKSELISNVKYSEEGVYYSNLSSIFKEVTGFDIIIPNIMWKKVEGNRFEKMGEEAYKNGLKRKPILDKALTDCIERLGAINNDNAITRNRWIGQWFDGYDRARDSSLSVAI